MSATFRLETVDPEVGRIFAGDKIIAHVVWTDSFWCITGANRTGVLASYVDLTDAEEMGDAYLRAIADPAMFGTASVEWDFFLDPPTFVGAEHGEAECWIYTAHKLVLGGGSADFREWSGKDFAAANAIYRRVRRKYGDSPPDKTEELRALMADRQPAGPRVGLGAGGPAR